MASRQASAYQDFSIEHAALVADMSACGTAIRVDGIARAAGRDVPVTTPHHVFVLTPDVASAIKRRIQALDGLATRIAAAAGLAARPRALTSPRILENVERVVIFEKVEHESNVVSREAAIQRLLEVRELQGGEDGLAEALTMIENDPCQKWTIRKNRPSVGIRANIWLTDGQCIKDVYVHRNGLVLFGEKIEVVLPSGRGRRTRSDKYGEPDARCEQYSFFRHDGQKRKGKIAYTPVVPALSIHHVIEHIDESGGAADAWL